MIIFILLNACPMLHFLLRGNFSRFFVVDILQVYLSLYTTIASMADQVTSGTVVLSDSLCISSLKVSY